MLADPALAFDGDASNLVVIGIHRQWRGDLPESLEPANLGQQVSAVAQEMKVNAAVVAQTVQGNEWRSAKRQNVSPNDLALGWAEQAPPPGPGLVKKLQELEESAAFTGVRRGVVIRSQLQPPGLQDGGPPGLRNDGPPGQQGDGAAGPPGPPGSVPGDHGEQDEDGNDDDSSETEEDNAAGDTAGEDSSAADLINGGPPLNVPPVNLPPLIP